MNFLVMHITNQKLRFDIFTLGNLPNIFMDPYNVLLAIATNIPLLLMTGFVLQGHILVRNITSWIK